MFRQIGAAAALLAVTISMPAAADAQRWDGQRGYYQQIDDRRDGRGYDRGYRGDSRRGGYDGDRGYDRRGYDRGGYDRGGDDRRDYRGRRGRCDKGTGGTIIGAIAGGLLGNSVAGRGDRTAGALVGAGVGALAGRAIDRDC